MSTQFTSRFKTKECSFRSSRYKNSSLLSQTSLVFSVKKSSNVNSGTGHELDNIHSHV